jgi:hypothetical protein
VNISVVDAEVPFIGEGKRGRGGDRPDPELNRRLVRDEAGNVLADAPLDVPDLGSVVDVRRDVDLDARSMSSTWMKLSPSVAASRG